ncbi:MAG: flagellar filament capping protein FliD [Candidatus Eisenbacteria sp.]|nr:flagellar filament capping protein FliD [Candidatus Eisenbacteria bacterium]
MSMSSVGMVYTAGLGQFLDIYLASSRARISGLESQRDALDMKTAIYTDLKSKLSTLRDLAEDMAAGGTLSAFGAKSTTSSDADVLTATAGAGAVAMAHTIHIEQLARAHSVLSGRYTSAATDLSAAHAGTKSFTITVDGTDYDVSLTINSGDTNEDVLAAIAQAINDVADIPVRASRIDDTDSTSKLYIAGNETGTENKMTFTDTDGLLAALGVTNASASTDTVGGYIYADLGGNELDAKLTVDGVSIIRSSNSVSDVLTGVTLTLLNEQEAADADITMTVSIDTDTIKSKVEEFFEVYNDAYEYLSSKISVDTTTYTRGALAGDYSYVNLWQNMRSLMAGIVSTVAGGNYSGLSQIGISSTSTGSFSISDADDFVAALTEHLDDVEDLFNSAGGIATALEDLVDDYSSAAGIVWTSKDAVSSNIDRLDDQIDRLEQLQDLKQEELIKQYGASQQAMYMQQVMLSMISSMNSWIQGSY